MITEKDRKKNLAVVSVGKNKANTYKSRAGGQGPYLRSPDHLGRISEVKEIKS